MLVLFFCIFVCLIGFYFANELSYNTYKTKTLNKINARINYNNTYIENVKHNAIYNYQESILLKENASLENIKLKIYNAKTIEQIVFIISNFNKENYLFYRNEFSRLNVNIEKTKLWIDKKSKIGESKKLDYCIFWINSKIQNLKKYQL